MADQNYPDWYLHFLEEQKKAQARAEALLKPVREMQERANRYLEQAKKAADLFKPPAWVESVLRDEKLEQEVKRQKELKKRFEKYTKLTKHDEEFLKRLNAEAKKHQELLKPSKELQKMIDAQTKALRDLHDRFAPPGAG